MFLSPLVFILWPTPVPLSYLQKFKRRKTLYLFYLFMGLFIYFCIVYFPCFL